MLLSLLLPALVAAGAVSGRVKDVSGRPVAMVLVSAAGQSDFTDIYGKFRLTDVPNGQQILRARKGKTVREVNITVGPNTNQDITLP